MLEAYFDIAVIVMICVEMVLSQMKFSEVTLEKIKKGLLVAVGVVGGIALFIADTAYGDNLRYPEFADPLWYNALILWGLLSFSFFCLYKQLKKNVRK